MRAGALFLLAAFVVAGLFAVAFFAFGWGKHADPMACKEDGKILSMDERKQQLLRSAYAEQQLVWDDFDAFVAHGVVIDTTFADPHGDARHFGGRATFGGAVFVPRYGGDRDSVKMLTYTYDTCGRVLDRTALSTQQPGLFEASEVSARWSEADD
tara:strand:+ start:749 stop:1213 length:465 start_codon:yes stop_codon:yes gene_type:complete